MVLRRKSISKASAAANDDLDHHVRKHLISLNIDDDGDEGVEKTGDNNSMQRAVSMLDMNDIRDMVHFGEVMDALGSGAPSTTAAEPKNGDDSGDGFFIDEEDDNADATAGQFIVLSSSPDCVMDVPQANETLSQPPQPPSKLGVSGGVGGMRRVMSVAALSSMSNQKKKQLSLSMMMQDMGDIHPISEEGELTTTAPSKSTSSVEANNTLDDSTKEEKPEPVKFDPTIQRRPSRRATQPGMPLKSSLKGSSNNLRSSLKSTSSIGDSTSKNSNGMKRNVSFSSLEIRSYNITLGDAPTSYGPPVQLDWEYDPSATTSYDIDNYEMYRTDEAPRRNRQEMLMPPMQRQYLLMREHGFTRGQIKTAMDEAKRVAKQREKTVKLGLYGFVEPMEEVLEKTRRMMMMKKKKRITM